MKEWAKEKREYLRNLTALTVSVKKFLNSLDLAMREKPKDDTWGKSVARLANWLEMENDRTRYFALGVDYRTDKKTTDGIPLSKTAVPVEIVNALVTAVEEMGHITPKAHMALARFRAWEEGK